MAKDIKWVDKHIEIAPPKRLKKVTGTRFASILGLNAWSTPFEMWCAITKTYEKPFEDTIYTIAGKTIEPKQADYVERSYGMDIVRPKDVYGEDYFNKTYGDFFPDHNILGGMWDYLAKDENGKVDTVLEMKTTKRIEDWKEDVPEYYALQAALYAWLYGVDNVIMVASFLGESDYQNPEAYQPSAENTILVPFKVSERYPNFQQMVDKVLDWHEKYVQSGISPDYDEKRDADILKALRTNSLSPDTDVQSLIDEAEKLKAEIDALSEKEKRYKELTDIIKKDAMSKFRDGDKKVELAGKHYTWTVSKSTRTSVDSAALKKDGLYEKYSKSSEVYTLKVGDVK